MRVISRSRLRRFWESRTNDSDSAQKALRAWEKIAKGAIWSNWSELKQTFGTADRVGNCIVFNVGNNAYRLIARVMFNKERIYILKVMDHGEYDKKDRRNQSRSQWETDCNCHEPPPKSRPAADKLRE